MTISKLSIAGFSFGILTIILVVQHWWIRYYDLSNFLFGMGMGTLIMFLSYTYNWMRQTDEWKARIQNQADTIGAWVTDNTLEAEKEKMLGSRFNEKK